MKGFLAFTKKELLESIRTYKLIIIGIVFLLLGIMGPLTAKLTPVLLESFMPDGMSITIADPTAMDSWMQFFKNVPQLGLVALVILYSGIMSSEYSRGTLINVLTKGLSRSNVILSKFAVAMLTFTAAYILCYWVSYAYTAYYWSDTPDHLAFSAFCLWFFGILLISALMLGAAFFRTGYGSMLFAGGLVVVFFVLNLIPKLQKFNPARLASDNMSLLKGTLEVSDFTAVFLVSSILIVLFIFSAIVVFNKKQL